MIKEDEQLWDEQLLVFFWERIIYLREKNVLACKALYIKA